MPEGPREGDIDFLKSAVRDAVDGFQQAIWESGMKCIGVSLEPAQRTGDDYFVKVVGLARCRGHRHLMFTHLLLTKRSLDFDHSLVESNVCMVACSSRNMLQDALVCRRHNIIICRGQKSLFSSE